MKSAVLIAGSRMTRDTLMNQIYEYLDSDVEIRGYSADEGLSGMVPAELYIISSDLQYRELIDSGYSFEDKEVIIGKRTLNIDHLDKIVALPKDTCIAFINDSKDTAEESLDILYNLGITHIDYTVYYPGLSISDDIKIGITPGELSIVPSTIETVIDIGPRIFDFSTIANILGAFGVLDDRSGMFSKKYLQKIIGIAQKLSQSQQCISDLNDSLKSVIDGLEEGLMAYDAKGEITVFNEPLYSVLKPKYKNVIGLNISKVITNEQLLEFLMDDGPGDSWNMSFEGEDVYIRKTSVDWKGVTIASFRGTYLKNFVLRNTSDNFGHSERNGYIAKYTLQDIVGRSQVIQEAKSIAKKLAETDMTILIEGESGTGKEMFASSIHNASKRKDKPFLAINFSALPDNLIESELFGYEEGAFTGAKKGGKKGFFELANGGTIFLDEIGDISLKVQSRLLRVLEEKEIMPVGGNKIRSVNVRVIAATNKNLFEMIKQKRFREDLYFRLKIGYIHLQPLRERREDIPLLLDQIVNKSTIEHIDVSHKVYDELRNYDWKGNVRELKNMVTYMLAVKTEDTLTMKDLPQKSFFQKNESVDPVPVVEEETFRHQYDRYDLYILKTLIKSPGIGRTSLSENSYQDAMGMTENQIRRRLKNLERQGYVKICRGSSGTSLTLLGESMVSRYS